ncbi:MULTISPECIES: DUF4169 family protein [unclassified Bosea (in: a-proteobacteria)]|uniref:DUF4169 family protein n=1 Tax=unclassified Bosea (in: a-proteobacteria) TaxID=2653178 RepID=UPI000F75FF87|nr:MULTISPECIES: DUF4169 family protein [unclassified Bosea (in: a-proteobacteria)]AZO76437.1 hypothetical protein BLM15_01575 [Bosea sp. Tri-49]RXT26364.1 hypothetical protein B5U98_07485 [Bosea sp. Tri-39]RXT31604.1 hypothetical protein B5U99_23030 [Bosea sp. Tri-54]
MAEIVNLRRARKARDRASAEAQAEQNRIAFGRTKAERRLTEAEKTLAERRLEGHRLSDDPDGKDNA